MKFFMLLCLISISFLVHAENPAPTETGTYSVHVVLPAISGYNPLSLGTIYASSREELIDEYIQRYNTGFEEDRGITTDCSLNRFVWNGLRSSFAVLDGEYCVEYLFINHSTTWSCPPGYVLYATNAAVNCSEEYTTIIPYNYAEPQCNVGNPVSVESGVKTQKEVDIYPKNGKGVRFERIYSNNSNRPWHHSYSHQLKVINPRKGDGIRTRSFNSYSSRHQACINGWDDIKENISESWSANVSVRYVNNQCQVVRGENVVRNIAVVINEVSLTNPPTLLSLLRSNGSIHNFISDTGSTFRSLNGEGGKLFRVNDDGMAWRYVTKSGDIELYSSDGKLVRLIASDGTHQQLFYDDETGLLARVEDSVGGTLIFAYTNGRLSGVATDGQTIQYFYNTAGLLVDVERPDDTHRLYHYEDSRFPTYLTGITDERGVRYATWTYDYKGRAISSEHAGGTDKTLLAFSADGSTTVTNPLGKQTTYHFDDIAGARRVTQVEGHATTSCEGANQNYTYTPEGWIESKTDWKGNITTYSYNTFGQEISRTEASGTPDARTITTEWHPDLYVKTRVVDGGRETLYTYDDSGRLLSTTTNPLPIQ